MVQSTGSIVKSTIPFVLSIRITLWSSKNLMIGALRKTVLNVKTGQTTCSKSILTICLMPPVGTHRKTSQITQFPHCQACAKLFSCTSSVCQSPHAFSKRKHGGLRNCVSDMLSTSSEMCSLPIFPLNFSRASLIASLSRQSMETWISYHGMM